MSKLSVRLRDTADWINRTRDGPGLRELVMARLLELADSAEVLEADAIAMRDRLQRLPVAPPPQLHLVRDEVDHTGTSG
jgi:hypothetical protein